jgi:capsid assembly protease
MFNHNIYEITELGYQTFIDKQLAIRQGLNVADMFIQRKPYSVKDTVGYIDIQGPLVRKASNLEIQSGITSYEVLEQELEQAYNDDISMLVLTIDSPGGESMGSSYITKIVESFNKPVIAMIDGLGASAAYKIASAATQIIVSEYSQVGSIGSMIIVDSTKELNDKIGIKRTIFTNEGATYKGMGGNFGELDETEIEFIQQAVDKSGKDFQETVLSNRPEINKVVFNARTFSGKEAIELGLVDFIM